MNPLTRLFRKQSAPQGVTLEIQSGFTAFSGTTYGTRQSCRDMQMNPGLNDCCVKAQTPI